jgi:predicted amidohydrolase
MARVALIQFDLAWQDRDENLRRAATQLDVAVANGAQLAVLPEMFATGFSMAADRVAEPAVEGPVERFLCDRSRDVGLAVCASVAQRDADGAVRNRFLFAADGRVVARYDKAKLFSPAGEQRVFAAGVAPEVFAAVGLRIVPLVCYDLRFPELLWNVAPVADVAIVVANWPRPRRHHWRSLLVARAVENQLWVVGVNRVGTGGGLEYSGDSLVVNPDGEIVADAGAAASVVVVEVDPAAVSAARVALPVLDDR